MHPTRLLPLFAVALLCLAAPAPGIDVHDDKDDRTLSITVTGEGEVNATPDLVRISLGVVTQADSAQAALEQNNKAMNKLFQTLEKRGIPDKKIQTTSFNVSPRYRHEPKTNKQILEGYQVTNQVTIEVKRTSSLGELLDEVVSEGANNINGISFDISDPANLRDQARREAIRDARQTAELYAKQSGMVLGHPLKISEHGNVQPMPRMESRMRMQAADAAVPIAAGESTVRATVQVEYSMAPAAAVGGDAVGDAVEKTRKKSDEVGDVVGEEAVKKPRKKAGEAGAVIDEAIKAKKDRE